MKKLVICIIICFVLLACFAAVRSASSSGDELKDFIVDIFTPDNLQNDDISDEVPSDDVSGDEDPDDGFVNVPGDGSSDTGSGDDNSDDGSSNFPDSGNTGDNGSSDNGSGDDNTGDEGSDENGSSDNGSGDDNTGDEGSDENGSSGSGDSAPQILYLTSEIGGALNEGIIERNSDGVQFFVVQTSALKANATYKVTWACDESGLLSYIGDNGWLEYLYRMPDNVNPIYHYDYTTNYSSEDTEYSSRDVTDRSLLFNSDINECLYISLTEDGNVFQLILFGFSFSEEELMADNWALFRDLASFITVTIEEYV